MKNFDEIPTLNSSEDWLKKAIYDLEHYKKTFNIYDATNCMLTLNALPEWILKDENLDNENLKKITQEKLAIMKGQKFELDENLLEAKEETSKLDHQLKLIRLFCNHSKHLEKKAKIPQIVMSTSIPTKIPAKFINIKIGNLNINLLNLLNDVVQFWKDTFENESNKSKYL